AHQASSGNLAITVTPLTPSITWNVPAPIAWGTPLSATQLNATANVPGTFSYAPAAGTILELGAGQPLTVTFIPTDSTNYSVSGRGVPITITKVRPVLTWAPPAAITFGTALGAGQLNASANVSGAFAYTPAAGTVLPVGGGQALSAVFTPTDPTHYSSGSTST